MEEEKKYKGFYCQKCNYIPLIQIIPKINNIKIFSSCKCHKQYQNYDTFVKNNYLKKEIDINKISNESIINNINKNEVNLDLIKDNLKKVKEKVYKEVTQTKDKLIDILNKKIDEINEIYKKNVIKNKKIIFIIEEMIRSFEILKDNPSNINNLLNNCIFNETNETSHILSYNILDSFLQDIDKYFQNKLILNLYEEFDNINFSSKQICYKNDYLFRKNYNKNNLYDGFLHEKFLNGKNPIRTLIEMDNNLFALCFNNNCDILIYNNILNHKIIFKAHSSSTNWIIKTNKNYLISCGDDNLIKIWPPINEKFYEEKIESDSNITDLYKNKKYNRIWRIFGFTTNIDLNPIFIYEFKNLENIQKMINLKQNKFLAISNQYIYIFHYNINENNDLVECNMEIELMNTSFTVINIDDAFVFKKENTEIIVVYTQFILFFLDISNLEIIHRIEVELINKNSLVQVDKNNLLLKEKNHFKVIDLKNFKLKLIIENNVNDNDYLFNMGDETLIQCYTAGIKRYSIKTFEELPILIYNKKNDEDEEDSIHFHEDFYLTNYSKGMNIVYLYQLKDKRLVTCYKNGKIELCNLKFI